MFEEQFFVGKKMNIDKLLIYGFEAAGEGYSYSSSLMNNQFLLQVYVNKNGGVSTKITDCLSEEEYTLYKVIGASGSFVGAVRDECESVLSDIAQKCFDSDVFQFEQTLEVLEYVKNKYGDEPEFLWEKFSDSAVLRRKDSQKWYGIIMTISKNKLGLPSNEKAEVIDLRLTPDKMEATIDNKNYFPGWHMNKKHWYTMLLDNSVSTEELYRRIDDSYLLAVK